jgi:hypothetical protein
MDLITSEAELEEDSARLEKLTQVSPPASLGLTGVAPTYRHA